MALPAYLAMTDAELRRAPVLPAHIAYMACHFSSEDAGLTDLPKSLPPGAMLIVNDRIPVKSHDPALIAAQLRDCCERMEVQSVLLDFQRAGNPVTQAIADTVTGALSCPVGISQYYRSEAPCAVFIAPIPPHRSPESYLKPWLGRKLWLDISTDGEEMSVRAAGAQSTPLFSPVSKPGDFASKTAFCHYRIAAQPSDIRFTLYRTRDDLSRLLAAAERFGAEKAIGMYPELRGAETDSA